MCIRDSSNTGFELDNIKLDEARNIAVFGNIAGAGEAVLVDFDVSDVAIVQVNQGTAPAIREHLQATGTYAFRPLAPVLNGMGFLPQNIGMEFVLVARSTMRAL